MSTISARGAIHSGRRHLRWGKETNARWRHPIASDTCRRISYLAVAVGETNVQPLYTGHLSSDWSNFFYLLSTKRGLGKTMNAPQLMTSQSQAAALEARVIGVVGSYLDHRWHTACIQRSEGKILLPLEPPDCMHRLQS